MNSEIGVNKNSEESYQSIGFDSQIEMAKRYPRDIEKCYQEALSMATRTKETATKCFYTLERGKEPICGPSIRLGEILLCAWGNISSGVRIYDGDRSSGFVVAQAFCWDSEKNVKVIKEARRSIRYANGGIYSNDMQAVAGNAAASIALRNAIFSVIPRAFVDSIYEECKRVAVGEGDEFYRRRAEAFSRLEKAGVSNNTVLTFFNKKSMEEFDKEDLVSLMGIGNAIKDGLCTLKDAFLISDANKGMSAEERINNLINKKVENTENEK